MKHLRTHQLHWKMLHTLGFLTAQHLPWHANSFLLLEPQSCNNTQAQTALPETVPALNGTWHIEGSRWLVPPHFIVLFTFNFDLKRFNTIIKAGQASPFGREMRFLLHPHKPRQPHRGRPLPRDTPSWTEPGLGAPPLKLKPLVTRHMKEDANHAQERLFSFHSILGHKPKIIF